MRSVVRVGAVLTLLCGSVAYAGEAENIQACSDAVHAYSDKAVDEFDVIYEGHILDPSTAKWPGVYCEVKLETVINLQIDGKPMIVDRWPSPEAKEAFDAIDRDVTAALDQLQTRKALLEKRRSEAEDKLRMPGSDIGAITKYVEDGIGKALGK